MSSPRQGTKRVTSNPEVTGSSSKKSKSVSESEVQFFNLFWRKTVVQTVLYDLFLFFLYIL